MHRRRNKLSSRTPELATVIRSRAGRRPRDVGDGVHELLFCFDRKLYQQMLGLFMGCKPSPIGAIGAIVRVYTFERRSLYIDPHYLPTTSVSVYGRYVDDAETVAESEDQARNPFNHIADEDPDGHLGWEIDYPSSTD